MRERGISPTYLVTIDLKTLGHFPCGDLGTCGDGGGGYCYSLKKTVSYLLPMKTSDFL
jgi:hypothetical protein